MSKTLKMSILLLIITLGILFLSGTGVKAVYLEPTTLENSFSEKNVTINGTTITLKDDVDFADDVVEIFDGDFVLNLNGHTITAGEIYISDGKLTIEDSKGNGKIDVSALGVEETGTLIINNGIFSTDRKQEDTDGISKIYYYINTYVECYGTVIINNGTIEGGLNIYEKGKCTINNGIMSTITNEGNLTINNAIVSSIMNVGTITIQDGSFGGIGQDGKATINGGVFTAHEEYIVEYENEQGEKQGGNAPRVSVLNINNTILNGGEFKKDGVEVALDIYSSEPNVLTTASINNLVGEGYLVEYEVNGEAWEWNVSYKYAKVIKDELLDKIAPNGIWDFGGLAPKDFVLGNEMLTKIVDDIFKPLGYSAYASISGNEENFNPEKVKICVYKDGFEKEYDVSVKYLPENSEKISTVKPVLNEMRQYKDYSEPSVENAYVLEDLYLINYLFANADEEYLRGDQALNFSKELIDATGGANISFEYVSKMGDGTPNRLYSFSSGEVIVYYEGKPLTTMIAASLGNYVLYIPDTVDINDDNAVIAAATKRIKDYIGENVKFTIKVAGTLDSIKEYNPYTLYDETKTGDNYYHLKIGKKSYNFVICKKEASKLEQPKYVGNNLESNVVITSDNTTIPLDTSITVEKVKDNKIEEALGTSIYAAYDISLYSNAKQSKIKEIEDGTFKVSVPVPENLKNKNITVYYIDSEGKKTEHTVTVTDGIATFETDHFSTYVLVEKVKADTNVENNNQGNNNIGTSDNNNTDNIKNPQTGDNIFLFVVMLLISIIGITVTTKFGKKE